MGTADRKQDWDGSKKETSGEGVETAHGIKETTAEWRGQPVVVVVVSKPVVCDHPPTTAWAQRTEDISGVTRNGTLAEYMLRDRTVGSHGATLLELVSGGETRDGPSRWNVKGMSRPTWQKLHASQ